MTDSAPAPAPAPASAAIRIIIVDDQQLVRAGFAMVIDSQPDLHVVAQAGNGHEAVAAAAEHACDVVLMDVRMPEMDGIAATRAIVEAGTPDRPSPRVIILTTFDIDEYVLAAIRNGASGFLLKDAPPEEMLSAIRTVHRGDAVIAPSSTRRLLGHLLSLPPVTALPDAADPNLAGRTDNADALGGPLAAGPGGRANQAAGGSPTHPLSGVSGTGGAADHDPAAMSSAATSYAAGAAAAAEARAEARERLECLTERELEVLKLVAQGLSNQEIAASLFVAEPTVKTHVGRLLAKLEARDRVQLVILAYEADLPTP